MGETANLVSLWRRAREHGEQICLATVVHIEGSSYRKPGARMLMTSAGDRVGTISGGCLEAEISRKAWWLTEDGPTIQKFASSFEEDDDKPRHGLGCGGIVWVLLERGPHQVLSALAASLEKGVSSVVLHRILPIAGPVGSTVIPPSNPVLEQIDANGVPDTWAEVLQPPPRLTILGAGDDALPLARFTDEIDWRVRVADARTHLLRAERFPSNVDLVPLQHDDPQLEIGPDDFAVILTHSYQQDRALLKALLPAGLRYLGILGPRHRTARLIDEVAPALGWTAAQCWDALHSPVGLDLGTRDPASIALAIAAELQATASSRSVAVSRLS